MKLSIKPKQHCKCGTYEHTIPMPVNRKVVQVDYCIADIVAALNAGNIITAGSCCGHGKSQGTIILLDERVLIVGGKELLKGKHF